MHTHTHAQTHVAPPMYHFFVENLICFFDETCAKLAQISVEKANEIFGRKNNASVGPGVREHACDYATRHASLQMYHMLMQTLPKKPNEIFDKTMIRRWGRVRMSMRNV